MERGGWARRLFDNEAMTFVQQIYQRAQAFLFGRRTYELFAGGLRREGGSGGPRRGALNTKPKYVASNTLTDPQWAGRVLSGDFAASNRELKARPGASCRCTAAAP